MPSSPLFKTLNPKAQPSIQVLNAPPSFEPELAALALHFCRVEHIGSTTRDPGHAIPAAGQRKASATKA